MDGFRRKAARRVEAMEGRLSNRATAQSANNNCAKKTQFYRFAVQSVRSAQSIYLNVILSLSKDLLLHCSRIIVILLKIQDQIFFYHRLRKIGTGFRNHELRESAKQKSASRNFNKQICFCFSINFSLTCTNPAFAIEAPCGKPQEIFSGEYNFFKFAL